MGFQKDFLGGSGVKKNFDPPPKKNFEENFFFEIPWNGEKIEGKKMGGWVGSKMYQRQSLKRVYFRFGLSHQKSENIGWTLVKRRKFWDTTRTHFYASFWVKKWKKDFKSILST